MRQPIYFFQNPRGMNLTAIERVIVPCESLVKTANLDKKEWMSSNHFVWVMMGLFAVASRVRLPGIWKESSNGKHKAKGENQAIFYIYLLFIN